MRGGVCETSSETEEDKSEDRGDKRRGKELKMSGPPVRPHAGYTLLHIHTCANTHTEKTHAHTNKNTHTHTQTLTRTRTDLQCVHMLAAPLHHIRE
jgi:hypothetical protein